MLINDMIPFIDNTGAHPQSADPHLEKHGISIIMPNRQQLHVHNICIRQVAVAAQVTTYRSRSSSTSTKCRLLLGILMRVTPDRIGTQTRTKGANN